MPLPKRAAKTLVPFPTARTTVRSVTITLNAAPGTVTEVILPPLANWHGFRLYPDALIRWSVDSTLAAASATSDPVVEASDYALGGNAYADEWTTRHFDTDPRKLYLMSASISPVVELELF